jgi:hypothetical protein
MFPVKPTTVARYRSAFRPSGAKDDPTDAEVILELLMRHRDKLERLQPEREEVRQLRRLVELRRDLVHDRTRLTNRITDALKAYFPQVLGWFADKEAAVFADFLERWPTLQHAQRARPETLRAFFHAANVRRASAVEKRLEAIRAERPLHHDAAVIGPARMLVEALLPQLRTVSASIKRFDAEVARLSESLPDYGSSLSCPARARRWPPVCWRPLVSAGSASPMHQPPRSASASRRSSSVAATRAGCTGASAAASFCGRRSWSGPVKLSLAAAGRKRSTSPTRRAGAVIKPPCVLWPSNGFASSTGAGATASPTTNPAT